MINDSRLFLIQIGWDYAGSVTLNVGLSYELNNISPKDSLQEIMKNIIVLMELMPVDRRGKTGIERLLEKRKYVSSTLVMAFLDGLLVISKERNEKLSNLNGNKVTD